MRIMCPSNTELQKAQVDWCFANLTKFTWGIKSVKGITYIYFDKPADAEKFADYWGSKIQA